MRTINGARNPRYADPRGIKIDLEVDFDELDEVYVPFTCHPCDANTGNDHEWVSELYSRAVAGEFGEIQPYDKCPDDLSGDDALNHVRAIRNELLAETDYVENPTFWNRLSDADQAAWTTYRNALRDITTDFPSPVVSFTETCDDSGIIETTSNLAGVTWPEKPVS